ncbi:PepSY-like domain-containing protein [Sphingobacterium suaedae]|uniref:PepSY-like domain-containing protein n=1 Tax=Sphingobacterium suaedae TaxID=1686402 RepID=A0ABW5KEI2_9SPHI
MKKTVIGLSFLAAVSCASVSCDDDKVISDVELPESSRTFLSSHFNNINVSRIEKEGAGYSVYLANKIEIDFNSTGDWLEVDGEDGVSIPTGFILPQIVDYVEDNYPTTTINGIEKKASGFDVDLVQQDTDLVFDVNGGFVRVDP